MTLLQTTLAAELETMEPVGAEADGIDNFSGAFANYFYESAVAGIPANPGTLVVAVNDMKTALVGISSGGSELKIQTAIIAFWNAVALAAPTIWTTAPPIISATIPPTLTGVAAALTPVFASNISGKLTLQQCAANIAAALHPLQLGGIAVLGPPPPGGTPTPIL